MIEKGTIGLLGRISVFLMMKVVLGSGNWLMLLLYSNTINGGILGPEILFGVTFFLLSTVRGPILLLKNGTLVNP